MTDSILICSDLDRTLIPNGTQAVSSGALEVFSELCQLSHIQLCYVTGRNLNLTTKAIADYKLPSADFLICDVGASAYYYQDNKYIVDLSWRNEIESDWNGMDINLIHELLDDIDDLIIQESHNQSMYKLSYFSHSKPEKQITEINKRLSLISININIISSYDEVKKQYLIDILPKSVSKLHAINFLMEKNGDTYDNTVFCGDSGNDMDVFLSGIPSIIVNNAHQDVIDQIQAHEKSGSAINLYKAKGDFNNLNGNYVSGILEGLSHYHAELKLDIEKIINQL